MQSDPVVTVFLPIALGVIMLGLGLSLTIADFRRVLVYPKAVIVGLMCQVVLLPIACFFIAKAFGLAPALAVGMMLLAASPGGISANLYSHLANGDVALNITLTAINSLLSLLTLPLIVNWSLIAFMGEGKAIPLQFSKVVQLFTIVLGPVAIGMWVNYRFRAFAESMRKPVKILAALCLLLVILLAVAKNIDSFTEYLLLVGSAALCFNLVSLAVGFFVPRFVKLPQRQCIAISMEIGIHNGTLAIAIALSPHMLNNLQMAMPAAIYGIVMFFTAAVFAWWINRRYAAELGAAPQS